MALHQADRPYSAQLPALLLANAAYHNDWSDLPGSRLRPDVICYDSLVVDTPGVFNNTKVYVALVKEWDEEHLQRAEAAQGKVAAVFAFRGSQPYELKDWLLDISFLPTQVPWAPEYKAHGGFLRAFSSVSTNPTDTENRGVHQVLNALITKYNATANNGNRLSLSSLTRLISTGHSLGGALATLNAVWWYHSHLPELRVQVPVTLITAGAPRVLSTAFAAEVKAWHKDSDRPFQNFRFVHGRDPVPSLGPQDWGFAHGVRPIWLHKGLDHWRRIYFAPCEEAVRADEQIDRPLHMTGMLIDHFEWRYLIALQVLQAEPHELLKQPPASSLLDQLLESAWFRKIFIGLLLNNMAKHLLAHGAVATGAIDSKVVAGMLDFMLVPFQYTAHKVTDWVATVLD